MKGGTYSADEIVGKEVVEAYGGSVRPLGVLEGWSTTQIVGKIRGDAPMTLVDSPILPLRKAA